MKSHIVPAILGIAIAAVLFAICVKTGIIS